MPIIDMRDLPSWPAEMSSESNFEHNEKKFEEWWATNGLKLAHLGPIVAEQWVFRHFNDTLYAGLPLDRLRVQTERMSTNTLLTDVYVDGWEDKFPEYDWETFYEPAHGHSAPREPGRLMQTSGTPRTPILLLHTPDGFVLPDGSRHDRPYCLIEGHTRWRCIRGLNTQGQAASEHDVLALSYE